MSAVLLLTVAKGTPVLRGHDHWWSVIRELGRDDHVFTVSDVVGKSNCRHRRSAHDFVQRLHRAGYLADAGSFSEGGRRHRQYRLVRRPAETPVLRRDGSTGAQGGGQAQMWNAIRLLGAFSATELAVAATTEEHRVAVDTAFSYALRLERAGYLAVLEAGGPAKPKRWRLKPSMNTGPKAPLILRTKIVWDQNRGCPMGDVLAEEDCP